MKYVKHMTNCASDPKIQSVIDEFGPHGYAAYWLIVERVAADFNGDSAKELLRLPAKTWQKITYFSQKKLKTFLDFCKKIELFSHFCDGRYISIIVPKLLKYGDEYAQKHAAKLAQMSGQNPTPRARYPSPSPSPSPSPRKDTNYLGSNVMVLGGGDNEF